MVSLLSQYGSVLSLLFARFGVYVGMVFNFVVIFSISLVTILRKKADNVLISEVLKEDCDRIRSECSSDAQAADEISKFLYSNAYSVFCGVGIFVVKLIFALCFGYGLCDESVKAFTDMLPIDVYLRGSSFISIGDIRILYFVLFMLIYFILQYVMDYQLSLDNILDSRVIDIVMTCISSVLFFIAPIGYAIFMVLYTLFESLYIWISMVKRREQNLNRIRKSVRHFKGFENNKRTMKNRKR